jgi:DNA replication and repair protein RecF
VTDTHSPALARLTLSDFRNYTSLRLEVGAPLLAFAGPNGAGKTNLLEAVSLLAPGRGLRGADYDDLARHGAGSWAIAAELRSIAGPVTLGTGWTRPIGEDGTTPQSRIVVIDSVQATSGAFCDHVRMIWLTPAMDRLFAGPTSERRRFLDRLVALFDPEHGSRVSVFERLMRERNLLLAGPRPDPLWLDGIESHMAESGIAIAAARTATVDALRRHTAESDDAFPWAEILTVGEIEQLALAMPAVRAEDEYRNMMRDSRIADKAAGRTLHGPHRSDLKVLYGPKSIAADQCSTGEQKALLIGLILAEARAVKAETGRAPILLLDEIAAHLDRPRRHGFFDSLAYLGCQAWMTGTDSELFSGLGRDAALYRVDAGRIMEAVKA